MSTGRRICGIAAAVSLAAAVELQPLPSQAQGRLADVPAGPGRDQKVLLAVPPDARAIVVMLPGGGGIVDFDPQGRPLNRNFLVRTLPLWLAQGFMVVLPDAPDHRSLRGYRHTPAYAAAIDSLIGFARSRRNLPVWLVGTSQGSTAAANGAAHLGVAVSGAVLSSSVTRNNSSGETVFDSEPSRITAPVLIVANQADACPVTPPTDAPAIAASLTRTVRKEVVVLASSQTQQGPCDALSPHGYFGIESEAVRRIGDWITAAGPR